MEQEKDSKRRLSTNSSSNEEDNEVELLFDCEDSISEPELDCDLWDADCRLVTTQPEKTITGYHLMPTCERDPAECPSKKLKLSLELRTGINDNLFKCAFTDAWKTGKQMLERNVELIVNPFKCCVVNNFLENHSVLNCIRQEFNEIDWNIRLMDLYEFSQSKDLKHLTGHAGISALYEFLKSDVMKWVSELTGFKLTHISAMCSSYTMTDYLLVHDDQRNDRMVAFILYLTGPSGWSESNGGLLELLNKDSTGQPLEVVRHILPVNNQFVFFPVTNDSYHQVSEVTSMAECRLSINGWFHTDVAPEFVTPPYTPYPDGLFGDKRTSAIYFDSELPVWVNEVYLQCDNITDIKAHFEEHSEISLGNFLREEPFNELLQLLQFDILNWITVGPPNRCRYEVVKTAELPVVFERFLQLFQSTQMFALLTRLTGLSLTPEKATMKFEFQKWTPGCYSLLGDDNWQEKKELDVVFCLGCSDVSDVIGGCTQYVNPNELLQEAIITLEPEQNKLNLIYRDTARFTKYYSKLSRCRCFYTLMCSYSE